MKYNSLYKPFSYINIYENKLKFSTEHIKSSTRLISSTSEKFLYQMANQYNLYLIIEIIPNYDFEQLNITINLFDGAFDLVVGPSKDIKELWPGLSYYIFMPSYHLQTLNVRIKTNYMPSQPFNSIDIYEYEYKDSPDYNYYENKPISFTKNNNQLEGNIVYTISFPFNFFFVYTVLEIKPIENIKNMSLSLDIIGGIYEFYESSPKIISKLKSNKKYYLSIYAEKNQKTHVTLKINNKYQNKPFDNVNIYEYSKKETNIYSKKISPPKEKGNELIISFSHEVKLSSPELYYLK